MNNNPAGRLHKLFRNLKRQNDNITTKAAWEGALGLPQGSSLLLYDYVLKVNLLVEETEQQILLHKTKPDIYLRHFSAIRTVTRCTNFDASWRETKAKLTEEVLQSLEFCSEFLGETTPERLAEPEELANLEKEITELFDAIKSSTIEAELKRVLLGALQSMRVAIVEYQIEGVQGLRKELFNIFARLERHTEAIQNEAKQGNLSVARFGKLMNKWDMLTSVWLNTPAVLQDATRWMAIICS